MTDIEMRFWDKVRIGDGCWEWTGATMHRVRTGSGGYGVFQVDRKPVGAHRFAWSLKHGPIPPDAHVMHTCDNRRCVRASHLRIGTHAENMADRASKGRTARLCGSDNATAKLSDADVRAIRAGRAAGRTGRSLAQEFGVSEATVSYIIRGRRWGSVS